MLFPDARHFCRPVKDGDEIWIETAAAAGAAADGPAEDENAWWCEAWGEQWLAETLWARAYRGREVGGVVGVVASKEVEEGIWFRHVGGAELLMPAQYWLTGLPACWLAGWLAGWWC